MKCLKCKNKAQTVLKYTQVGFCKKCYNLLLEKRVKQTIRKYSLFKPDSEVVIFYFGDTPSLFLLEFMEKHFFNLPKFKYVIKEKFSKRFKNKILILPTTLTYETNALLNALFTNNNDYVFGPKNRQVVKPLIKILDDDLREWAKLNRKKIIFAKKFSGENNFLEEVEKRRRMVRFSMFNLLKEL